MRKAAFCIACTMLCIAAVCFQHVSAYAAGDPYIGITHEVVDTPPGLQVTVAAGTPGDLAGLRTGDIITALNGIPFSNLPETPFSQQLSEALKGKQVGDSITLTVFRDIPELVLSVAGQPYATSYPLQDLPGLIEKANPNEEILLRAIRLPQTLDINVVLGARPDTAGAPLPENPALPCDTADAHPGVRMLLEQLIDQQGIRADCDDLSTRLNARATPDDGYRLSRATYLLRDGLKGEAITRQISDTLAGEAEWGLDGYYDMQYFIASLLDLPQPKAGQVTQPGHMAANGHLDFLQPLLETAAAHVRAAFAGFTDEERAFITTQREALTQIFAGGNYIQEEDTDPKRIAGNLRLIELAKRIDYAELELAQLTLAQIADGAYLTQLRDDLMREFADQLGGTDLLVRDTPLGKLVISGIGHSWRQGEAPALLIDLGGDDFYTTTAGSGTSLDRPVGVLIELGGNDAYESTQHYSQGCGSLGCGMLIDLSGNDEYIGLQWAQGCAFLGMGALLDMAGDDVYRGEELCQAAAIFGSGMLVDFTGNDRMEGQNKCQAFGGAHGIGIIVDGAGDDYRYAKGKYPTNYGDAGIFDAWSQGCAQGFRGYASGGIAGIIDCGGADYNEAGNFSQGGGYYFGYGFLHDRGWEGDRYIGSRYNQGFCAHQAIGMFLEEGGDDYYHTRQAVAQGLAWDECSTMFIDYAGDDRYEGGGGFSQGASAHNALCVMWDRGGRDTYVYPSGQARAGGNDYHGGTSLSLFIDEGGMEDSYDCPDSKNNLATGYKEHGFFVDLPSSLASALAETAWKAVWVPAPAAAAP